MVGIREDSDYCLDPGFSRFGAGLCLFLLEGDSDWRLPGSLRAVMYQMVLMMFGFVDNALLALLGSRRCAFRAFAS